MRLALVYAALAGLCLAQPLQASTVSLSFTGFDGLTSGDPSVEETEAGFRFLSNASYRMGEYLYLHDDTYGLLATTFRRDDNTPFDALQADFRAYTHVLERKPGPHPEGNAALEVGSGAGIEHFLQATEVRVGLSGVTVGGTTVSEILTLPADLVWDKVGFSDVFRNLTAFSIALLLPPDAYVIGIDLSQVVFQDFDEDGNLVPIPTFIGKDTLCYDTWCSGVQMDNLVLRLAPAPIPLPLPAALLGGGLLGLLAFGRRQV